MFARSYCCTTQSFKRLNLSSCLNLSKLTPVQRPRLCLSSRNHSLHLQPTTHARPTTTPLPLVSAPVFARQSMTHPCPMTTPLPFVLETTAYAYPSTTFACPSDPPLDIHLHSCLSTQDPCLSDTAVIIKHCYLPELGLAIGFSVWHS